MPTCSREKEGYGSLLFESGGVTYAVNGLAKTAAAAHGWHDLEEIWPLLDPSVPGIRKPLFEFLDRGLPLCDE
jgi:hypothetical protein